jgi:SAM-dependent MidA family methyltransferase
LSTARNRLLPAENERISICDFMARALYDADAGYYTQNIAAVGGKSADFATSASLDPGFSEAITRWIEQEIATSGDKLRGACGKWHLIELGGGSGHLAKGVLRSLGWLGRRKTQYHLVELSPVMRNAQAHRLGGRAKGVQWHSNIKEALEAAGGRAIIFSNEFIDAFPATVVQWDEESDSWCEVFLEGRGKGRFAEVLAPIPSDRMSHSIVFDHERWSGVPLRDGQRCEILFSWRDWLQRWEKEADAIAMLTIDYGDTFPLLYRGRQNGTLRAYLKHERLEGTDIYANVGQQDLTADVNFTELQHWGEQVGFESVNLESQRDFLLRFGSSNTCSSDSSVSKFLLDPAGAGEAFRVLVQKKEQTR